MLPSICTPSTARFGSRPPTLIVPLVCLPVFVRRGATMAVAFCAFWTFENQLYIATYMGDARGSVLPLVGSDGSDGTILITHWGPLQ